MPSRWFRHAQQFSISDNHEDSQVIDTPPYQRSIDSNKDKSVKLQYSTESYFTAADVLIQIDKENDE